MKSFGSRDLIGCLLCLEFTEGKRRATSHVKYICPKKVEAGTHPFITVILGRKTYDPVTRGRYITQLKILGYTTEEIESCM